jgi:hypothetical protein
LPRIKADKFRIQQLFPKFGNAVNYIDKEQGLVEVANSRWRHIVYFFYKRQWRRNAKRNSFKIFEPFKSLQQANTQQV